MTATDKEEISADRKEILLKFIERTRMSLKKAAQLLLGTTSTTPLSRKITTGDWGRRLTAGDWATLRLAEFLEKEGYDLNRVSYDDSGRIEHIPKVNTQKPETPILAPRAEEMLKAINSEKNQNKDQVDIKASDFAPKTPSGRPRWSIAQDAVEELMKHGLISGFTQNKQVEKKENKAGPKLVKEITFTIIKLAK